MSEAKWIVENVVYFVGGLLYVGVCCFVIGKCRAYSIWEEIDRVCDEEDVGKYYICLLNSEKKECVRVSEVKRIDHTTNPFVSLPSESRVPLSSLQDLVMYQEYFYNKPRQYRYTYLGLNATN